MESLIRKSLKDIGLEELPIDSKEDLSSYGLDSLMSALLFSQLETAINKNLNTTNFTENSFRSIESIEHFIKGESK